MSKPKLTPKQAKFVKGIVEGKTQADAYIEAYDTKGHLPTVEAEASKTTKKPQVKQAIISALERKGLTDDSIAGVIMDGLSAQNYIKTERVEGAGKNRLKTEELMPVPDLNTRHKYLETTLKLTGASTETKDGSNTFNFVQVNQDKGSKYAD